MMVSVVQTNDGGLWSKLMLWLLKDCFCDWLKYRKNGEEPDRISELAME